MALPDAFHKERFSQHLTAIETLYRTDEEFKSLCDDYLICQTNKEKYKGKSLKDQRMEAEYQVLSTELEREIIQYLKGKPPLTLGS